VPVGMDEVLLEALRNPSPIHGNLDRNQATWNRFLSLVSMRSPVPLNGSDNAMDLSSVQSIAEAQSVFNRCLNCYVQPIESHPIIRSSLSGRRMPRLLDRRAPHRVLRSGRSRRAIRATWRTDPRGLGWEAKGP
jgi:hypothetical protein